MSATFYFVTLHYIQCVFASCSRILFSGSINFYSSNLLHFNLITRILQHFVNNKFQESVIKCVKIVIKYRNRYKSVTKSFLF